MVRLCGLDHWVGVLGVKEQSGGLQYYAYIPPCTFIGLSQKHGLAALARLRNKLEPFFLVLKSFTGVDPSFPNRERAPVELFREEMGAIQVQSDFNAGWGYLEEYKSFP